MSRERQTFDKYLVSVNTLTPSSFAGSSPFLLLDDVSSVFYYTFGSGYAGGRGKALFSANGKPIITARYSLWGEGTSPEESPMLGKDALVEALLGEKRDSESFDGYSVVACHAWTHTASDISYVIRKIEEKGGGEVETLTPDDFVSSVLKNVKH